MATQAEIVESLKSSVSALQERARGLSNRAARSAAVINRAEVGKRVQAVQQRVIGGTAGALRWQSDGLVKLAGTLEGWAVRLEAHPMTQRPTPAPAAPADAAAEPRSA